MINHTRVPQAPLSRPRQRPTETALDDALIISAPHQMPPVPWHLPAGRGTFPGTADHILGLQRTLGNAHVQRLLQRDTLQRCGDRACNCSDEERARHTAMIARAEDPDIEEEVAPLPAVSGTGQPHEVTAYSGPARSIRIQGKTNAHYNGGAFHTDNVVAERGSGCTRCRGAACVHVTGDIVVNYAVTTTVRLPTIPAGLTPCQRQRVQDAIDNDLRPHEQQHVDAFNTYNDSTTLQFDQTICRNGFDGMVRGLVTADEQPRRAAAQAASDALDPHEVTIDLNCTDAGSSTP